ncbi:MAG: YfhO family protein [Deltaproteobacteria bacterium]|nr:YfhO family protein [Deltaproteobacteria bacterium]
MAAMGERAPGGSSGPATLGRTLLEGLALGALCTLAVFWRVAFLAGQTLAERDLFRVYLPARQYWADRIAAGHFPDWFPHDSLGQSFPGALVTGAFHPSNFLYLLASLPTAFELNLLLSYLAAFTGMYAWLRRGHALGRIPAAAGAVTFGLSGYLVSIHNNLLYLMATATLPWLLWALLSHLRRPAPGRLLLASAALASILLCGDPQAFVIASGMVVVYTLLFGPAGWRSDVPRALAVLAGGTALAAVQLVPVLSLRAGLHAEAMPLGTATQWSTLPARALDLFLGPVFSPNESSQVLRHLAEVMAPDHESWWAYSLHLGAAAMLLLLVAAWRRRQQRRVQVLALISLLLFTLMLGRHALLYGFLHAHLPFWNAFRYPEKLGGALSFLLAFGVAFALADHLADARARRRAGWILAGGGALLALLGGLELAAHAGTATLQALAQLQTGDETLLHFVSARLAKGLLTAAAFTAVGGAALLLVRRETLAGALLVASLALALLDSGQEAYRTVEARYLLEAPATVQLLRRRPDGPRMAGFRVFCPIDLFHWRSSDLDDANGVMTALSSCLASGTNALWGIESAESYLPGASTTAGSILKQGRAHFLRYSGLFSVRFAIVDARWYADQGGRTDRVLYDVAAFDQVVLYNEKALPRAFLAPLLCLPSLDEVKKALSLGWSRAERGEVVFAECPPGDSLPPAPEGVPVGGADLRIVDWQPEHLRLEVETPVAAGLVINDAHYPGWTATVDGEEVPIHRANQLVRVLRLPAGEHRVELRYRTPGLILGASVSGLALAILALWTLLGALRGRREGVPHPVTGG